MRKTLGTLLLIGVGWWIFENISRSNVANNLRVRFRGLKLSGKGSIFSLPDVLANFDLVNAVAAPLPINSIVGDIYVNDSKFSSVEQLTPFTIAANAVTPVSLKVKASIFNVILTVVKMLQNQQKMKVAFSGTVRSGSFALPINQVVNLF